MKILYGVCGEGRGHAGRSFALAQRLLSLGHQIDVFTFDQGYDLFLLSGFPEKNLHRIPGLGFKETERGISPTGTIGNYLKTTYIAFGDVKIDFTCFKPLLVLVFT